MSKKIVLEPKRASRSLLSLITGGFDPVPRALESYKFWRSVGYDHETACAWLGNEDGETSFKPGAAGDKVQGQPTAFGPAQHHKARLDNIKNKTGIDIKTASHLDQLKAIDWESSKDREYGRVRSNVQKASGMTAKITVLVHDYEHSQNQATDIVKRTLFATYWSHKFQDLAGQDFTA